MEWVDSIVKIAKNNQQITLAATAIIAASTAYLAFSQSTSSSLAPAISEEESIKALSQIHDGVLSLSQRMKKAAENVRMQIQQQGQDMEMSKIFKSFILPHFETQYSELQSKTLSSLGIDEADLEEAVLFYKKEGHPEITKLYTNIRTIYKNMGGEIGNEDEEEDEEEEVMELPLPALFVMIDALEQTLSSKADAFMMQFRAQFGPPSPLNTEMLMEGIMALSEAAEDEVAEKFGVSKNAFQQSILKHSSNPQIQSRLLQLQARQQMKMKSFGIQM